MLRNDVKSKKSLKKSDTFLNEKENEVVSGTYSKQMQNLSPKMHVYLQGWHNSLTIYVLRCCLLIQLESRTEEGRFTRRKKLTWLMVSL